MNADCFIGIDLGGTKILAGAFDKDCRLLARQKLPTEADRGPENVLGQLRRTVESVLKEAKLEPNRVAALGMGIPGQIDPKAQLVRYAPNLGWRDFDLAGVLKRHWSWPCYFDNDVQV